MKKIIFILLILTLLVTACSVSETLEDNQEATSEDKGYLEDIDKELDNSDLDSLEDDLDLGWI